MRNTVKRKFMKIWRTIGYYGRYTVALIITEINGKDKVLQQSNQCFKLSEIKEADKLAAILNERDGFTELYE